MKEQLNGLYYLKANFYLSSKYKIDDHHTVLMIKL